MVGPSSWTSTGSLGESSNLLANECSTPIRTGSPAPKPTPRRHTHKAGAAHIFDPPPAPLSPEQLSVTHGTMSRRLSSATLLRSRSIAALREGEDDAGGFTRSRVLALLAVCTLSIGSHFTMYLLGPLKSRLHRELGSSNSQFSLLVSALNLNSTWTPLVGGILVARFGTASSSVVATAAVLIGEIILYAGVTHGSLVTMACGLFVFGLGMTPLMVIQETLLARLSPGGHLGLSLALGLVSGKSASFLSALLSLPLAEAGGDGAPFFVALLLCSGSFLANLARLFFRWGEERSREGKTARVVKWDGVSRLGDVFWVYIILNIFCGAIWQPFLHLSANLVQIRFDLTEGSASFKSSVLLAGAIVLYPIVGYVTDRCGPDTPRTTFQLFHITSVLTLFCYVFLSLPVALTRTPWPGLIAWALGHGASTLLLVVLIPRILPVPLVPLGLGIHKAMEVAASTSSQTLAGLWLDWAKDHAGGQENAAHGLLIIYAVINVVQLFWASVLWRFEAVRRHQISRCPDVVPAEEYERLPLAPALDLSDSEDDNDDDEDELPSRPKPDFAAEGPQSGLARTAAERKRSRVAFICSLSFIGSVWVLFIATAWKRM